MRDYDEILPLSAQGALGIGGAFWGDMLPESSDLPTQGIMNLLVACQKWGGVQVHFGARQYTSLDLAESDG